MFGMSTLSQNSALKTEFVENIKGPMNMNKLNTFAFTQILCLLPEFKRVNYTPFDIFSQIRLIYL